MTMLYGVYFYTIIIFFATIFLLEHRFVESFGKRRCRSRQKIIKDNDIEPMKFYNPLTDSENDFIDPHCSCDNAGFGIVQKIPYLPIQSSNFATVHIQFSSACIRCGLCLAVAEQINQTLLDTHAKMRPDQWLNDTEAISILKSICDHEFRHYSLREISGKRYICDRIPGATFVASTADGLWEKNLKNKCEALLLAFGASNLYNHWQKWSGFDHRLPDLATILCRGEEGLLRDCKSLRNLSPPKLKKDDSFFSKIRVMVEVKCK